MIRRDSWWRTWDEYGQWSFTEPATYVVVALMGAVLLLAAWLEGAWGCLA